MTSPYLFSNCPLPYIKNITKKPLLVGYSLNFVILSLFL